MPLRPPPVDYDALRRAVLSALRDCTGLDGNHVIVAEPEKPNWPRPSLPYLTYKVTAPAVRYGLDWLEPVPGVDGDRWLVGPRGVGVSLNAFGTTHEEAYSAMALVQSGLGSPTVQDALSLMGVAVWSIGAMADLSVPLLSGYEGRAQMDVRLGVSSRQRLSVGHMEHVAVDGVIRRPDEVVIAIHEEL